LRGNINKNYTQTNCQGATAASLNASTVLADHCLGMDWQLQQKQAGCN